MSKWFASARDLSDSESSESSEEEQTQKKTVTATASGAAAKKPLVGTSSVAAKSKFKNFDESEESEEEQRVVKTGSDKRREALNSMLADLKNHLKINDFGSILTDFERLSEEVDKALNGAPGFVDLEKGDILPTPILRAFIKIEDTINETVQATKDKKMNLSKQNSVSFNKLKQKVKKYLQSTGPTDNNFEKQMAKFREAPVWSEDERAAA
jgi:hypothetical protein